MPDCKKIANQRKDFQFKLANDICKKYALICIEDLNIKVYFADAYATWQRGSNENSNGLLREYYPKKTDLGQISNDDLIKKLILLNSRPRECLNWDNPFNLFLKEVSHLDWQFII